VQRKEDRSNSCFQKESEKLIGMNHFLDYFSAVLAKYLIECNNLKRCSIVL
jgi:hypothetical protein